MSMSLGSGWRASIIAWRASPSRGGGSTMPRSKRSRHSVRFVASLRLPFIMRASISALIVSALGWGRVRARNALMWGSSACA